MLKSEKRERKRFKQRYGMKMSGRSLKSILQYLAMKSPPRRRKRDKRRVR